MLQTILMFVIGLAPVITLFSTLFASLFLLLMGGKLYRQGGTVSVYAWGLALACFALSKLFFGAIGMEPVTMVLGEEMDYHMRLAIYRRFMDLVICLLSLTAVGLTAFLVRRDVSLEDMPRNRFMESLPLMALATVAPLFLQLSQ